MTSQQSRWLIAATSSAVLVWMLLRRRMTLLQQWPEFVETRIVLPMGGLMREAVPPRTVELPATGERMARKVGRNRKISVGGKLYGPLAAELVGQSVEVEVRDGHIVVFEGPNEIGRFERQA